MRRRALLAWAGSGVLIVLVAHLVDLQWREAALQAFLADKSRGTVRIAKAYGVSADQCVDQQRQTLYPLAAAFITVESLATPRLSAWARGGVARAAAALGSSLDISIGPGRIRPSTARAVMHSSHGTVVTDTRVVDNLLDPCGAIRVAIAILEERTRGSADGFDLDFIRQAAAAYNGQATTNVSLQAAVASQVYFDLIYNEFQHYRFMQHS